MIEPRPHTFTRRQARHSAWLPVVSGQAACVDHCCPGSPNHAGWSGHLACFVPSLRRNWQHDPAGVARASQTFSVCVSEDSASLTVIIHDDDDDFWSWTKMNPHPEEAEAILRWIDGLAYLDLGFIASRLSKQAGWAISS